MSNADCNYGPAKAKDDCPHEKVFTRIRAGKMQLSFPQFCFAWPTWIGASYIVYEFNLVTPAGWISFPSLYKYATTEFLLAVRTRNHRYKFWEGLGEKLFAPIYNGEPIYSDAVFEIWNSENQWSPEFPSFTLPISGFDECACPPTFEVAPEKRLWVGLCEDSPPSEPYGIPSDNKLIFSREKPCDV